MRGAAALLASVLLAGCISDPYRDPVPGKEAVIHVLPGPGPASVEWPVSYRRGAVFVIENRTKAPVETLILDLSGPGQPRELTEIEVLEPAGVPAAILWAPHGTFPLRAQVGVPGTVLLAPGAAVRVRLQVSGEPSLCRLKVAVPE